MHASEFVQFIESADSNQCLMARILLNSTGLHLEFPVDIWELRKLNPLNRAVVEGFLTWVEHNSDFSFGEAFLRGLRDRAKFYY